MRLRKWIVGAGGVLLVLTAVLHAFGHTQKPSAEHQALEAQMAAYRLPFGTGNDPTMLDAMHMLSWTMSLAFLAIGLMVLGIIAMAETPDRLLRRVAWMNALWLAVFAGLSCYFRLPPPAILGAVSALVFAAALVPRAR